MRTHVVKADALKLGPILRVLTPGILSVALLTVAGCGSAGGQKQNRQFFTSGSREADQRASQRMAKEEQIAGSGEGAGQKRVKKASKANEENPAGGADEGARAQGKLALFERLGGEKGITAIVEDFIPRALQDPRVNWDRKGATRVGLFHHEKSATWNPTPENVARLKQHLEQFLALASGGPAHYDGKEMKAAHTGMHITNAEFDAAVGDLKASLDKLQIPNTEQKELLAIVESTRPEIVAER